MAAHPDTELTKVIAQIEAGERDWIDTALAEGVLTPDLVLANLAELDSHTNPPLLTCSENIRTLLSRLGITFAENQFSCIVRNPYGKSTPYTYPTCLVKPDYRSNYYNIIHLAFLSDQCAIASALLHFIIESNDAPLSVTQLTLTAYYVYAQPVSLYGQSNEKLDFNIPLSIFALALKQYETAKLLFERAPDLQSQPGKFKLVVHVGPSTLGGSSTVYPFDLIQPHCQDNVLITRCAAAKLKDLDNKLNHAIATGNVLLVKAVLQAFPSPSWRHRFPGTARIKSKSVMNAYQQKNPAILSALLSWCNEQVSAGFSPNQVVNLATLRQHKSTLDTVNFELVQSLTNPEQTALPPAYNSAAFHRSAIIKTAGNQKNSAIELQPLNNGNPTLPPAVTTTTTSYSDITATTASSNSTTARNGLVQSPSPARRGREERTSAEVDALIQQMNHADLAVPTPAEQGSPSVTASDDAKQTQLNKIAVPQ